MKKRKNDFISCPCCGMEYLPEEIYLPFKFFGNPKNILKDNGKILSYENQSLDTNEKFICDGCGKEFSIDCKIQFTTNCSNIDFNEEWYEDKHAQFILDES